MTTAPDHSPCWHIRVLAHPRPRHGHHADDYSLPLSEPPPPKEAICCWCGVTAPYENITTVLPTAHPR